MAIRIKNVIMALIMVMFCNVINCQDLYSGKYQSAMDFIKNKDYQKALNIFNQVDPLINEDVFDIISYYKGICYYNINRMDSAYYWFYLAKSKMDNHVSTQALAIMHEIEKNNPGVMHSNKKDAPLSYHKTINIYADYNTTGGFKKALKLTTKGQILYTEDSLLAYMRGVLNYYLGNINEAKKDLSLIINHINDSTLIADAHSYLGDLYYDENDFNNASLNFNLVDNSKMINDFFYKRAYSNCHKNSPDFQAAINDYNRFLENNEDVDTFASSLKAFLLNGTGHYDSATIVYNRCLSKDLKDYDCTIGRARVYINLGLNNEACADIQKARKLLKGRFKDQNRILDKMWKDCKCD